MLKTTIHRFKKCTIYQWMSVFLVSGMLSGHALAQENTFVAQLRGTSGTELAELQIGSATVATWEVSAQMDTYTATSDASGEVRVAFVNDAGSRDLQVDYLSINGNRLEAEEQATNTGAWDGRCGGGSYSEMLHCNGYISFGEIATTVSSSSTSSSRSTSSASSSAACEEQCSWYNSPPRPLCKNTTEGWGWENQQSCIGRTSCENQWGGSGIISECGEDPDKLLCEKLNTRTYFSDALYEMGRSVDGIVMGHRSVSFRDGVLQIHQSDYIIAGAYRCEDGSVLADYGSVSAQKLAFSDNYNALAFDSNGGSSVNYTLGNQTGNSDCDAVSGRSYRVDPAELAAVTLPAGSDFLIQFGNGQDAKMTLGTENFENAIYDCNLDKLHIHRTAEDATPVTASLDLDTLLVQLDPFTQWRFPEEKPKYCPNLYDPVCAVQPQQIQCLVAPCPEGFYQTYPNSCVAEVNGANLDTLQAGECGEREGKPYYGTTICPANYDPVCATVTTTEPCGLVPCPNRWYKTFGNACTARAAAATILDKGECGDLDGTKITEPLKGLIACTADYTPVCGKASSGLVCITSPCPTHEYKTYSNRCVAEAEAADVTWSFAECGTLQGQRSSGEPPVSIVESLATTHKSVGIKASIKDDILTATLSYAGCDEQHFDLQVARKFVDAITDSGTDTRVELAFIPMLEDTCEKAIQTELRYDLLPLKAHFQQQFNRTSGAIEVPGIGTYRF